MKIAAISVRDFKRVREVELEPGTDRALVLIGGKNAQGKSSILDALTAALGGGRAIPADPVRHGAERAEIRIDLDDGGVPLVVRRVIKAEGGGTLEIRRDGALLAKPQAVLDQIIGARFLDPLAFLALPADKQRAALLEMIDRDGTIAKMEHARAKHYQERTDLGRDLKRAQAELSALPKPGPAPAAVDVKAAMLRVRELHQERDAITSRRATVDAARAAEQRADAEVERLRAMLSAAVREHAEAADRLIDAEAELASHGGRDVVDLEADIAEALDAMERASEIDSQIAAIEAATTRRADADARARELDRKHTAAARAIADIDERKAAFFAAAALPVSGLAVDDGGLTYQGVTLSQASGAERLRVALAIAIAASPNLRDVWIRDGALLDLDHLALVEADAEVAGVRCWVERVGTDDPGAIVIVDGAVAE